MSGDTSCADHNIAWRVRHALNLDFVQAGMKCFFKIQRKKNFWKTSFIGVSGDAERPDNIIYDLNAAQPSGFGHPTCSEASLTIAASLEPVSIVPTK